MIKDLLANAGDAGDSGLILGLGRSPEEEMATHSSILTFKNPMDRGTWRVTVHGVARGRAELTN